MGDALLGADEGEDFALRVQVHAETPLIPAGHRLPEEVHAGIGRIAVGFRVLDRLGHLLDDEGRGGQVGVPHAQVDDIHSPGLDLGLLVVNGFKEIRRDQAQAGRGFKKLRHLACPFCNEAISQGADTFHPDFHHVAGGHGADPEGRAGGDDVAGQQRHDSGNKRHLGGHPEDHVTGVGVLPALPVEKGLHREVVRVRDLGFDPGPQGGEGVETLGPGELPVFFLQIPGGDVVDAGVPQDVVPEVLLP